MKFSTFASTIVGSVIFFASKVIADIDYFDWPSPNAVFRTGSSIQFVVDDMCDDGDDDDERVFANLYRENGSFVRTIRSWNNDDVDDDEFAFSWYVDRNLRNGRYFVEISCEDDSSDDDDVARSFVFELTSGNGNSGSRGDRYNNYAPNHRMPKRPGQGGRRTRYHKRAQAKEETQ